MDEQTLTQTRGAKWASIAENIHIGAILRLPILIEFSIVRRLYPTDSKTPTPQLVERPITILHEPN